MNDSKEKQKPNIIFIQTDQESTSLSGCYGNTKIKTPARDSLAENGARFNNHYIASFPCCPSRATMITGLYAHNHGIVHQNLVLDENMETLGSQLKKSGYDTIWIGKSHMGGWFEPHDEPTCPHSTLEITDTGYQCTHHPGGAGGEDYQLNGFDTWVSGWTDYRNYLQATDLPDEIKNDRWVGGHAVMETGPDSEHAYSQLTEDHHMANWMSSEAVATIEKAKDSENPFCMVLSYYAPHHPVAPPKPYDTMYSPEDMELPESYRANTSLKNMPPRKKPKTEGERFQSTQKHSYGNYIADDWTEDQSKGYLARYYGYVTYIDDQMTRVLDALKENGLFDNTIIVFTSDHGDMLCEHGMIYKHSFNGYDTLMKVPMFVQWPARISAGQVKDGLTSHVDIVPTLVELAGVDLNTPVDGISFARALRENSELPRDEVFLDVLNNGYMTRKGDWKFVLNVSYSDGELIRKIDELYNLADDPYEMNNLAFKPEQKERVESMTQAIFGWLETTGFPYTDKIKEAAALPME